MFDRLRHRLTRAGRTQPDLSPPRPAPAQTEPAVVAASPDAASPDVLSIGASESHDAGLHAAAVHGWYGPDGTVYPGFPVGPDDVVADIGCGDGGHSLFCAARGARVYLSDIDVPRLEGALARVEAVALGQVTAHPVESERIPLPDALATRVICTEVVEHVDDPTLLLSELFRITRPGGLLLLACPDPRAEAIQKHLAAPIHFQKPNHVRILSHEQFDGLARDAGFVIEHRDAHGFYWAVWWSLFWCTGKDLNERNELLDNWGRCWNGILDRPDGPRVQRVLDSVLPKSQILVCRKPDMATTAG